MRDWIYQLIDLGLLEQIGDEYPLLKLNPQSWEVMRNERQAQPAADGQAIPLAQNASRDEAWEGVDRDLFERLRSWRRETAEARGWPPFAVFSDNTLRNLARVRPASLPNVRQVYGIGDAKLQAFGDRTAGDHRALLSGKKT